MPYCDPINVPCLLDAMLESCDTVILTTPISFWDDVGIVVGLRLLMRAAVRRVFLELSGSAPVSGIAAQ